MNSIARGVKIILLSGLLTSIPVLADDVEIFFNSSAGGAGDPLVMFSLDYRPNTTSSVVCNFSSDVSECGWDDPTDTSDDDFYTAFYAEFTAADKADGKISFLEQLRAALCPQSPPDPRQRAGWADAEPRPCQQLREQ
ncbi:MAG: hypothetical protein G8D28_03720 [gamma proteobacterium symbiont of Phacoides pectinatus]